MLLLYCKLTSIGESKVKRTCAKASAICWAEWLDTVRGMIGDLVICETDHVSKTLTITDAAGVTVRINLEHFSDFPVTFNNRVTTVNSTGTAFSWLFDQMTQLGFKIERPDLAHVILTSTKNTHYIIFHTKTIGAEVYADLRKLAIELQSWIGHNWTVEILGSGRFELSIQTNLDEIEPDASETMNHILQMIDDIEQVFVYDYYTAGRILVEMVEK